MFHPKLHLLAEHCVSDHWSEKPGEILLLCQASSSIEYCDITGIQKTSHAVFKSNGGDHLHRSNISGR